MKISAESLGKAVGAPNIVGAWLFGSALDGEVREGADLDVAVLFDRAPTLDELAECRLRLQKALVFEEIDLVPLNGASPILAFQAVSGRRVYCGDEARCVEFVSLTAREYEDEMAQAARWMAG